MSRACEWYAGLLPGSPAAQYAVQRGLTEQTIQNWRIGYAPVAWRALLEAMTTEGFTVAELLLAGLIKEADGKRGTYYDRFRNRLIFPIRDIAARVVGFTGRALSADEPSKYLNSPETDLYHKSEILFGMDKAKDAIRTRGFTILVEGQMDVLLVQQAGFENTVALSGTALTERHVALMKRYSDNLMLVLDADAAGLSATAKSAVLALRHGLRVKAARLPKGQDPADLVLHDAKEFARRVKEGKPIVEFFLAELAERESDPHRLLRHVESVVVPLIGAVQSPMEREHFVAVTARSLGLSNEAVRESLARLPRNGGAANDTSQRISAGDESKRPSPLDARRLQLLAVLSVYPDTGLAQRVKAEYSRITEAPELSPDIPPESALFETEQMFGETPEQDAADELLQAFEEAVVREKYQEAVGQLRRAEVAGDATAIEKAQAECTKLSARLGALKK
jgi:DNA primase catalytic core